MSPFGAAQRYQPCDGQSMVGDRHRLGDIGDLFGGELAEFSHGQDRCLGTVGMGLMQR